MGDGSMTNLTQLLRRMTLGLVLAAVPVLGGCSGNTLTWTEEVKLLDGRVITVTQKRRYDANKMPREFWLTFSLPELGNQEITWHEDILAQMLNVHQGKLYVVGTTDTEQTIRKYGNPNPPYLGYSYEAGQWQRIPFTEIPVAIYDTNLLIANAPPNGAKFVSFAIKAEEMKDDTLGDHYKKITATFRTPH
jgi:hypothetical protein